MQHIFLRILGFVCLFAAYINPLTATCQQPKVVNFYQSFKNPPNTSKLFVRWWWNGDKLSKQEISRELDVLKKAGIGGVEINPIKFQPAPDPTGYKEIKWLSDEWLSMVKHTVQEAKKKQIICDMIVGSGWPFGGEFLTRDEQSQVTTIEVTNLKGPGRFTFRKAEILNKVNPEFHSKYNDPLKELIMARLVPLQMKTFEAGTVIPITQNSDVLTVDVPEGEHVLYSVAKITGYMEVINGAYGARGPVLNHFDKEAVEKFLTRMSDALKSVLGDLGEWFRAFFVDSIELEGANWTDDLFAEFKKRRGYDITPYYPFVLFKIGEMGNPVKEKYGAEFSPEVQNTINRVRYDLEITRAELFKERFLDVVQKWCRENNVKSRVQAYGHGYFPVESNFGIDIPENETWFTTGIGLDYNEFDHRRPHSMANKFVSSGAHLSNKNIISCEEQTNVDQVFNETLEQIKLIGDLSNLSGVTHSILHGYNYSPPEAPFPGWIQYGTYFSDRNTWWKYFPLWANYKARISDLFQNAEMQADIAILHPIADLWTNFGAQRDPFPNKVHPDYAHNLWEAMHQNGNGCDYLSEKIIRQSQFKNEAMVYGGREYKTIFLMEVESLEPATALALEKFVKAGGKIVFIGKMPYQSTGFADAVKKDNEVKKTMERIRNAGLKVFVVDPPTKPLIDWYRGIQQSAGITPYVTIQKPDNFFSQVYYRNKALDIFFLSNTNRHKAFNSALKFNNHFGDKTAWIWNAETGERNRIDFKNGGVSISLQPSESKLLVFEKSSAGHENILPAITTNETEEINTPWKLTFNHVNGNKFNESLTALTDLSKKHSDFAGTITYENSFSSGNNPVSYIDLGAVNGVTELYINNKKAGVKWYGNHLYDVSKLVKKGNNQITIVVTTTLGNYVKSLKDNTVAQRWTAHQPIYPCGLTNTVKLLK